MIIGISGKRGSGKSSLAKLLIDRDRNIERVSLAGVLKQKCKEDFGLTDDQVYGDQKELPTKYGLTPRAIMIKCGAYYRSIDPLFWCKKLNQSLEHRTGTFIVDDLRFKNEMSYFAGLPDKVIFVRLERSKELNIFKEELDDPSETELDDKNIPWNYYLPEDQNRTLEDLNKLASSLIGVINQEVYGTKASTSNL